MGFFVLCGGERRGGGWGKMAMGYPAQLILPVLVAGHGRRRSRRPQARFRHQQQRVPNFLKQQRKAAGGGVGFWFGPRSSGVPVAGLVLFYLDVVYLDTFMAILVVS